MQRIPIVVIAVVLTALGVEPPRAVEAALALLALFEADRAIRSAAVHTGAAMLVGALFALADAAPHTAAALVHAHEIALGAWLRWFG